MTLGTTKRILIAEDEKAYSRALSLKFQHIGCEVVCVEDGEQVLEELSKSEFDLLLLDIVMPKMDGFAVLEALKIKHEHTPIIILSNLSQADDEQKALALGAKEFLSKANVSISTVIEKAMTYVE